MQRNGVPFGGVSVILLGDPLQLKPVSYINSKASLVITGQTYLIQVIGHFTWMAPTVEEHEIRHNITGLYWQTKKNSHCRHELDPLWPKFSSIILEENHRQGDDKSYGDMLNRIRVEEHTEEDIFALEGRVFPRSSKDVQECNFFIAPKRVNVHKWNTEQLNKNKAEAFQIQAIHLDAMRKNFTPFVDEKDGVVGNTGFMDILTLKLKCPVMVTTNINTSDGITNGSIGTLFDVVRNHKREIQYLVVDLANPTKGRSNTASYPGITKGVAGRIVLEKVKWEYPLKKRGGKGGSSATVIQFPVRLAYAVTCHKMQGQTISQPAKVALDLINLLPDKSALAYVSLSRAKELKQIHIVNAFKDTSIRCSADAKAELRRLEKISINSNPSPYFKKDEMSIKVATLNCRGLQAHINNINSDHFLADATLINLLETSLDQGQQRMPTLLPDFTPHFYNVGNGKGIASFVQKDCKNIVPSKESLRPTCQMVRLSSPQLDIISVYKSSNHSRRQLIRDIEELIDPGKATFVVGDFNIDNSKEDSLAGELEGMGFNSMISVATHVSGGHLDHAYFRDPAGLWQLTVERFSPYYSDHDLIAAVFKKKDIE